MKRRQFIKLRGDRVDADCVAEMVTPDIGIIVGRHLDRSSLVRAVQVH
jgi:hypothetical protein